MSRPAERTRAASPRKSASAGHIYFGSSHPYPAGSVYRHNCASNGRTSLSASVRQSRQQRVGRISRRRNPPPPRANGGLRCANPPYGLNNRGSSVKGVVASILKAATFAARRLIRILRSGTIAIGTMTDGTDSNTSSAASSQRSPKRCVLVCCFTQSAGSERSPDGAERNPGRHRRLAAIPDYAPLHPCYGADTYCASSPGTRRYHKFEFRVPNWKFNGAGRPSAYVGL
jgi:hypothetical protein